MYATIKRFFLLTKKNTMAIIPQFYKNAVVSIGVKNQNSDIAWIGTGFFVTRAIDENNVRPFLVTNRHVFLGKSTIVIRMKEKDTENLKEFDVSIVRSDGSYEIPIYVLHTQDDIDIAVLPLDASFIVENHLECPTFDIDSNAMTSSELRENGFDEGSLIFMLGYTMGLVNQSSSLPICRLGCIARISKEQIQEKHNILVDIQNFPGNSGSPIINRPEVVSIQGTKNLDRSVLVGIIHSYIPYEETLINSQTGRLVEVRSENSGLAYAHPVEYIRDIIDMISPLHNEKSS